MMSDGEQQSFTIAVLPGDGIGPEVMGVTCHILARIQSLFDISLTLEQGIVGGAAIDAHDTALPPQTIALCEQSDAVLFGSVGGPKWETLPPAQQPERAALLPLRKHFNLFANLRPTVIFNQLLHNSPLSASLTSSVDLMIIRELTGGIYFAEPKELTDSYAVDTLRYTRTEIERIAHTACRCASQRGNHITSIDKANVLQSMVLWRRVVTEVVSQYPAITLDHLYVDNASMQLILAPHQFDVLLCPNMFGDILSDQAAAIPGSLGMQPSASLSEASFVPDADTNHSTTSTNRTNRTNQQANSDGSNSSSRDGQQQRSQIVFGLYEPAGGSAPNIAGTDTANPIAQILSAAMLFKYSFNRSDIHDAIYAAVNKTLDSGYRTPDIATESEKPIGTVEMGNHIQSALIAPVA